MPRKWGSLCFLGDNFLLSMKLAAPLGRNFNAIFKWNSNCFMEENAFESIIYPHGCHFAHVPWCWMYILYCVSDCPLLGDPMDAGQVQLGTLDLSYKRKQYQFDCVWQIKPSVEGFYVFLHIDSIDLSEDGRWNLSKKTSPLEWS